MRLCAALWATVCVARMRAAVLRADARERATERRELVRLREAHDGRLPEWWDLLNSREDL